MDLSQEVIKEIRTICKGNKCLRLLFDNAAHYSLENFGEFTVVHAAAWNGHKKCLKILLDNDKNSTHVKTVQGDTPLHVTAATGKNDCLRLLLQYGADIEAQTESGFRALHLASHNGNDNCLKTLLENGADIEAETKETARALHYASDNGKYICLWILLQNGANIEARLNNGTRPIHSASFSGNATCVQTLLHYGANINAQTDEALTALHVAAMHQHPDCMEVLLESGVDIDAKDYHGRTALFISAVKENKTCVSLLKNASNKRKTERSSPTPMDPDVSENINATGGLLRQRETIEQQRSLLEHAANKKEINPSIPTSMQLNAAPIEQHPLQAKACSRCHCKNCINEKNYFADKLHILHSEKNLLLSEISDLKERVHTLENQKLAFLSFGNGSKVPDNAGMVSEDYLGSKMKHVFTKENLDLVSEIMHPDPVIDEMWRRGDLSQEQYEQVSCLLPNIMKAKYLLGLTREGGPTFLQALRKALKQTEQKEIAEKLQ